MPSKYWQNDCAEVLSAKDMRSNDMYSDPEKRFGGRDVVAAASLENVRFFMPCADQAVRCCELLKL